MSAIKKSDMEKFATILNEMDIRVNLPPRTFTKIFVVAVIANVMSYSILASTGVYPRIKKIIEEKTSNEQLQSMP